MVDLELRGIHKSFGNTPVIVDFNLTVHRGEFVSLLGPSGCGKTTVLKLIAGFLHPDQGEIFIGGRRVDHLPAHKRGIGFVFQNYALFPHMTAFQNVAYGLQVRKVPRDDVERRVKRALERVRMDHLGHRFPRELSGGQQQRVAIARAIVIEPTVLLLDEPLSNLDAKLRHEMRVELRQVQQDLRMTTVFVTHDQDEALSMSDRILVMNRGRVEQAGTPAEVYERPATPFVAQFIGDSNFLTGRVVRMEGDTAVVQTTSGLELRVAAAGAEVGDEGTVAIRPERVRILSGHETASNRIVARVHTVTYLGTKIDYQFVLADGEFFRAHVPSGATGGPTSSVYRAGDAVTLGWEARDATFQRRPQGGEACA